MSTQVVVDGCIVWESREPLHVYDATRIREARDAVPFFETIRELPQEAFAVLELNGSNQTMSPARIVTLGLLDRNNIHPREVFADALKHRAASIIVAHNHPSGTVKPSSEDIALTERLVKAGKLLGVPVLDHIIIAPDRAYASMKCLGHM